MASRRTRRLGSSTIAVLRAIDRGHRYGFDIMDVTGLAAGTVYPALARLETLIHVRSHWEDAAVAHAEKRPPRRYYAITQRGKRALDESLATLGVVDTATPAAGADRQPAPEEH